ncbi:MAG: hypothetical protein JW819_06735 [Candidatus Krumholzibacteriota bacterium]|nr:hypothetical protein [Candidatus Krumholzibacteriota bacterium]
MRRALLLLILAAGAALPARGEGLRPLLPWETWLLGGPAPGAGLMDVECAGRLLDGPAASFARVRVGAGLDLPWRAHEPGTLADYRSHVQSASLLTARGGAWLAASARQARSELRQRRAYTDDDRAAGDLDADAVSLAGGIARRGWGLRLAAHRARGWGGSAALLGDTPRGLVTAEAGVERAAWRLDQAIEGFHYVFDFPFRREALALAFAPADARLPALSLRREVTAGEPDESTGDYEDLYARRHGLRASWPGGADTAGACARAPGVDRGGTRAAVNDGPLRLDAHADWGYVDLGLYADGDAYLRLSDLHFRAHGLELSARLPRPADRWSLLAGVEEWNARVDGGFFEPWPFSFWTVFSSPRYEIDDLRYRLLVWTVGAGRRLAGRRWRADLALRHHWLAGGGSLDWKERVWTLYPWFFRWDHHRSDLPLPALTLIQLDVSGSVAVAGRWRLRAALRQMAPLRVPGGGEGGGGGPAGEAAERFRYGGFQGRVALERDFY